MDYDLSDIAKKVISFRDARDWKQFHNPKDTAISLLLETAEFLEHFQWKSGKEVEQHLKEHKEDVADELADVLYWVLLIAHDLEISPLQAMENKLAKNEKKYPVSKAKGNHAKYNEL